MAQVRATLTSDSGPRFDNCKREAIHLLEMASIEWSHGDPSNPSPNAVREQIMDLFAKDQFLRRPYAAGR